MIPSLKNLTSTFIGNHVTGQECTQNFLNRLENLPWVFSALVTTPEFNAAAATHENSTNIFKALHKVKVLDLSQAKGCNEKQLYLFIKALATAQAAGAPALQELKLPQMKISRAGIQHLLSKLPNLVSLDLSLVKKSEVTIIEAFEELKQKPCKLVSLKLPYGINIKNENKLTGYDKSLALDSLFKACPQLKHLQIWGTSMSLADHERIAERKQLLSFGNMNAISMKSNLKRYREIFSGLEDGLSCLNLKGTCPSNRYANSVSHLSSEEINDIIQSNPNLETLHLIVRADKLSELNTAHVKHVLVYGATELKKLVAPSALSVRCNGSAGLEELVAPNALNVIASSCDSLQSLVIPAAKDVSCSNCPSLEVVRAPQALKLKCGYNIDGYDKLLKEIHAPNAVEVKADNCMYLNKLVAPKVREITCTGSALTEVWTPQAWNLDVSFSQSISKVYAPQAECLQFYRCPKLKAENIQAPERALQR